MVSTLSRTISATPPPTGNAEILFTDIIRGPVNSLVWIYGWELPSSPNVFVDATQCSIVINTAQWIPTNGNNLRLDRVCVEVPHGGLLTLENATGSLTFTQTAGAIHFYTPGDHTAFISLSDWSDGDVVYVRDGTYNIHSSNWANGVIEGTGATGVAICGYPGENAIIDTIGGAGYDMGGGPEDDNVFSNLQFLANNTGGGGMNFNRGGDGVVANTRIVGNRFTQVEANNYVCIGVSRTQGVRILGNKFVDCGIGNIGGSTGHEIYHGGRSDSTDTIIGWTYSLGYWDRMSIEIYGHTQESFTGLQVIHNYIDRSGRGGGGGHYGIQVGGSDFPTAGVCNNNDWIQDCVLHSNTVANSTDHSFRIREEFCAYTITDNVVINQIGGSNIDAPCCGSVVGGNNSFALPTC